MTTNPQGIVDTLAFDTVVEADAEPGPKVTFYVPTEVRSTTADKSAAILSAQLKTAASRLREEGLSEEEADALLAPVRELVSDSTYWRQQSRGLVEFAAAGFHSANRIPIEVDDSVTVSEHFHVRPVVPVVENSGRAYVLALSKNSVRLFAATRNSIEQLPQGDIPNDFDEVIGELPEPQLQHRSIGGGQAAFHGHGGADEADTMLTEKFLRAVGEAVAAKLGTARSQPLVLASVAEYLSIFRSVCPYPVIHDEVIAGNPEHTTPDALRSEAWKRLGARSEAVEKEESERALAQAHNGRGSFDLAEIAAAAQEGRVDTLFLPRDGQRLNSPDATVLADEAVLATVRARGAVRTWETWEWSSDAIAPFRY